VTVKACRSPHTLKVDGVVDQVVGQEAEFWGLFLFSFINGKVELCYKFHILERLVCPTVYLFHVPFCIFLIVYFKCRDFDSRFNLILQKSIT
jgi:hypothetical protein